MKHINLPENYKLYQKIDFENDRKVADRLSYVTIAVALLLIVVPLLTLEINNAGFSIWISIAVALAGCVVYSILHELIHAAFISLLVHTKAKFQWSFPYLCVGTDDGYFGKLAYAIYALAPVLILGAALLWLNITLPQKYFWCVYMIQIFNLSGATSDVYTIAKMAGTPKETIAQDTGREIYLFTKFKG